MNLIGSEVNNILQIVKMTVDPLYNLYEIDPGMKAAKAAREDSGDSEPEEEKKEEFSEAALEDYDESALWSEVKKGDK